MSVWRGLLPTGSRNQPQLPELVGGWRKGSVVGVMGGVVVGVVVGFSLLYGPHQCQNLRRSKN